MLLDLGRAESALRPGGGDRPPARGAGGRVELDQRFAATLLLAGVLGQTGHAAEGADVLETQFDAFAERPDLRGAAEAALANITRIDPTTRRRGDTVIGGCARGCARGNATRRCWARSRPSSGWPATRVEAAAVAERALAGLDASAMTASGWSWYNAVRTLVIAERYDLALPALDAALERHRERGSLIDVGGVLTFRAELYVHSATWPTRRSTRACCARSRRSTAGRSALGMAAAVLGEVLVERGELAEAEAVLFAAPTTGGGRGPARLHEPVGAGARGLLRLAQGATRRRPRSCASPAGGRWTSTTSTRACWRGARGSRRC